MICTHDAASHLVQSVSINATLREAATLMDMHNIGFLPVMRDSVVVGVITDRDIAIRGSRVCRPLSSLQVIDVMTPKAVTVSDEASIAHSAGLMAENHIRRLIVTDRRGCLTGVLSIDDLAVYSAGDQTVGQILQKMAKPSSTLHIDVDLGGDTLIAGRLYVEPRAAA
jgi:CBS domain-containing protein